MNAARPTSPISEQGPLDPQIRAGAPVDCAGARSVAEERRAVAAIAIVTASRIDSRPAPWLRAMPAATAPTRIPTE